MVHPVPRHHPRSDPSRGVRRDPHLHDRRLKVFGPIYVLTRGGPGNATLVPSYYAYSEFFQSQQVGYGATIATALTVLISIVAIVFIRAQFAAERKEQAL